MASLATRSKRYKDYILKYDIPKINVNPKLGDSTIDLLCPEKNLEKKNRTLFGNYGLWRNYDYFLVVVVNF